MIILQRLYSCGHISMILNTKNLELNPTQTTSKLKFIHTSKKNICNRQHTRIILDIIMQAEEEEYEVRIRISVAYSHLERRGDNPISYHRLSAI